MDCELRDTIPYIVYESSMSREERHIKRLIKLIVLLVTLWLITITGFVWYISLPMEEQIEYTQTLEDISESSNINQTIGDN